MVESLGGPVGELQARDFDDDDFVTLLRDCLMIPEAR